DIVCLAYAWFIVWVCWSKANGGVALLLTDGTMLMNECQVTLGTTRWWRLHPDANGSYFHGPWSRCADSHVARLYFASAVLVVGRVIVCGGEYSDASGPNIDDETNRCEIYDPVADTWTEIDPPQNSERHAVATHRRRPLRGARGWTIPDGQCIRRAHRDIRPG